MSDQTSAKAQTAFSQRLTGKIAVVTGATKGILANRRFPVTEHAMPVLGAIDAAMHHAVT